MGEADLVLSPYSYLLLSISKNYGHLDQSSGGRLLFIRVRKNFAFQSISRPLNNVRG